jgi:CRP-like cAMP-binding protein
MSSPLSHCQNRILQSLSPEIRAEVLSRAHYVELIHGEELYRAEDPIERIHFVEHGVVLFTKTMADGRSTVMSTADSRGTTMPYATVDGQTVDIACMVLIPGWAYAMSVMALQQIAANQPMLETLLRESNWRNREQVAQLSACNRLHSLKQRIARLLITMHDDVGSKAFSLTQQELALMLGARRPHVTVTVAQFQQDGLIRYHHGEMQITDPIALETASCECYGVISDIHSATPAFAGRGSTANAGHLSDLIDQKQTGRGAHI